MEPQKDFNLPASEQQSIQPLPDLKTNQTLKRVVIFTLPVLLFTLVLSFFLYRFAFSQKKTLVADNSAIPTAQINPSPILVTPTATESSTTAPLPNPPATKIIPFRTHAYQTFNNCGPATLSMALSYFDINLTQKILGDSLRPYQIPSGDNDDKSVFLAEITAKAQELGLVAYHRPAGDIATLKYFVANDIPVITRTWLNLEEDISHYRLVRGYDDNTGRILQDDSYTNKNLWFTHNDFNALWQSFNYEYIIIAPPEKQAIVEQILGESLNETKAWEKSLYMAQTEFQQNPSNFYAKFNASIALYHLGRYDESVQMYQSVQNLLPKRMLWYQLEPILAYYKLGQFDLVLSITKNILDNGNRAYSELYFIRGKIYESRGQTDLANQSYALATQYNNSTYWRENVKLD